MAIPWVDCWMVRNDKYCWTQALVSPLCQNHSTCTVSHYIPYQNLLLPHREYKWEMDNVLVYYS